MVEQRTAVRDERSGILAGIFRDASADGGSRLVALKQAVFHAHAESLKSDHGLAQSYIRKKEDKFIRSEMPGDINFAHVFSEQSHHFSPKRARIDLRTTVIDGLRLIHGNQRERKRCPVTSRAMNLTVEQEERIALGKHSGRCIKER